MARAQGFITLKPATMNFSLTFHQSGLNRPSHHGLAHLVEDFSFFPIDTSEVFFSSGKSADFRPPSETLNSSCSAGSPDGTAHQILTFALHPHEYPQQQAKYQIQVTDMESKNSGRFPPTSEMFRGGAPFFPNSLRALLKPGAPLTRPS